MKKRLSNYLLSCVLLFKIAHVNAQNEPLVDCDLAIHKSKELLSGTEFVTKNEHLAIDLLKSCASKNHSEAQYMLGMLYKNGISVTANEKEAFLYLEKAALQDHSKAACELGILYKDGIGCELNFDKAIQWFKKADELGNSKGSYSIGYLYFKGLGSIDQSYTKAIEWFKKSDYPMAQHWLGICNYFGYGTSKNSELAMELLLNNPYAINSEILAKFLDNNAVLKNKDAKKLKSKIGTSKGLEKKVKGKEFNLSQINSIITADPITNEEVSKISQDDLLGKWNGKLIELDWSGEKVNRSFSIDFDFSKNKQTKDLNYKMTMENGSSSDYGICLDENFYFNNLNIKLPRLYQDDKSKFNLDYSVLSASAIEIKTVNKTQYLIANIDTKVMDWHEPGPPMLLIMSRKNSATVQNQKNNIDSKLINALAVAKGDDFIGLYPNPFKSDLLIQYDLLNDSMTHVEMYAIDTSFYKIIANEEQKKGTHLYKIDGSTFKKGLYVVKVTTNGNAYTKLIIKE